MKIAYGDSRTARKWKNNEISWEDFCKRVSTTQYTTETVEEYRKMTKARRDAGKEKHVIFPFRHVRKKTEIVLFSLGKN